MPTPLREAIAGEIRPILMVLLDGAGLLLLIAGVNVAGLLLVRSEHRRREIAVRRALGASLARLLRQFIAEASVLTLASSVTAFMRGLLFGVSSWDVPTLAAAAGVLGVSGLLAGFIPAWRAMRVDPMVALRCE